MKHSTVCLVLVFMLFVVMTSPVSAAEIDMEANVRAAAESNNQFAIDLYSKLIGEARGNIFFSPYSISTALGMVYAGARGKTETEMAKALHFTMGQEQIHLTFGQIARQLNSLPEEDGNELAVANALWAQSGYRFLDEYLSVTKANYEAGLEELDFKTDPESCRKTINGWVEEKTNEKIKNLIPQGALDDSTRLVLTNAVYFNGKWMEEFNKEGTRGGLFNFADGSKADVPMMSQLGEYGYCEEKGLQVLEMPYRGDKLSMVVILPNAADGIAALEKGLSSKTLTRLLEKVKTGEVIVAIPTFKTESSFSLAKILTALGMKKAFTPDADFSRMNGKKGLFISAVLHKAYVDVNEGGTEAAAATEVDIALGGRTVPLETPVFDANHPFLFLIRDKDTGSILFMGRIMDPRK